MLWKHETHHSDDAFVKSCVVSSDLHTEDDVPQIMTHLRKLL